MKQLAGFYFDFRGGRTADDYFLNQHGGSLHFHRERDLFLSSSKNNDRVHKRFDLIEVIT